ncbi:tetratricopeptide repeat protein [Pseudooceanicola sp.]|uniref:tetratricopeptide repeat protein n=1 Tax=Pseudooceanicola sp. TaxID=1914328 RepID=UPI0026168C96|nr:tetratricopeptide repeat protein [Pseudooceanicola sp.]MDF1856536.1 tetratricopeptide repeat protein [Pseudooceanicola sp.]
MRVIALILCLTLGPAFTGGAAAQSREETLADIRQELTVLYVEIKKLKRELSTTGGAGGLGLGGSALQRLDAIEAETQRLTKQTEELSFRIDRVVSDGTNRIGDLEFRLVELEGGDLSKLGDTPTLGGGDMPVVAKPATPSTSPETELAVSEEADFNRAEAALEGKDYATARDLFATFLTSYPGSPLEAKAEIGRGKALEGLGEISQSARSYLNAFSGSPDGPEAPEALYGLGRMLAALEQVDEACVTLREIGVRFPASPFVAKAETEMRARSCP